jgi:beta-glucosidase
MKVFQIGSDGGDHGSASHLCGGITMYKSRLSAVLVLVASFSGAAMGEASNGRANALVHKMTLDEKLRLIEPKYPSNAVPGGGGGYIEGVPRLGIPDLNIVDSGTGSGSTTQDSTTFPAPIAIAASWDNRLSYDYGAQIARQVRAQGFSMGLGGGANLAREPRGGRLFEYLGEDPVLAGVMLAERTNGTHSEKVVSTIKHFAGNEQEAWRTVGNSQIDDKTLRELYLLPFQIALERSHPDSVICSYNRLNGVYACENRHLLTDILKGEWHFDGQVESDWGGTHSTVQAINAGLDEEEGTDAGPAYFAPVPVRFSLAKGDIREERIDDMVKRKLSVMISSGVMDHPPAGRGKIDFTAARAFAQMVEEQSIVLLKNRNAQLPLPPVGLKRIAIIGAHADVAVLSGGGSADTMHPVTGSFVGCNGLRFGSHEGCGWWRNPWLKLSVPILKAIQNLAPAAKVEFAGNRDEHAPFRPYSKQEIAAAVALALRSDVAIVVAAQPSGEEFGDLDSLNLANPSNQNELVEAVAKANSHTVVIIESGNPILMPWKEKVSAIVEAWYPGEGGGEAIGNVLFGKVNPSGKLPLSFPKRDEDTPTWGRNGALQKDPIYKEKLHIGYRWYDSKKIKPSYEFGFGLSYSHFTYSDLVVKTDASNKITISFSVRNNSDRFGKEIPQVYLHLANKDEPRLRLVGWDKVSLNPGETRVVNVEIAPERQQVWDENLDKWSVAEVNNIFVGASSRDVRLSWK